MLVTEKSTFKCADNKCNVRICDHCCNGHDSNEIAYIEPVQTSDHESNDDDVDDNAAIDREMGVRSFVIILMCRSHFWNRLLSIKGLDTDTFVLASFCQQLDRYFVYQLIVVYELVFI